MTISLTLKDRFYFTESILRFFEQSARDFKIIISDGSSDENKAKTRAIVEGLTLDIEYLEYPYDATLTDYYQKLESVLSHIKTPYVLPFDNDDYISVEGCKSAIDFLDRHTDYVAAGGIGYFRYLYKKPFYYHQQSTGYAQALAEERWLGYIESHATLWGLVSRTEAVSLAMQRIRTANLKILRMTEYIYNMIILDSGKIEQNGNNPTVYRRMDWGESSSFESLSIDNIKLNYEYFYQPYFLTDWINMWNAIRGDHSDRVYSKICEKWFSGCVNGYLQSLKTPKKRGKLFECMRFLFYFIKSATIHNYIKEHENEFYLRNVKLIK